MGETRQAPGVALARALGPVGSASGTGHAGILAGGREEGQPTNVPFPPLRLGPGWLGLGADLRNQIWNHAGVGCASQRPQCQPRPGQKPRRISCIDELLSAEAGL